MFSLINNVKLIINIYLHRKLPNRDRKPSAAVHMRIDELDDNATIIVNPENIDKKYNVSCGLLLEHDIVSSPL